MQCIICLQRTKSKNIVKPVCRCTIKQPVCKQCYNLTYNKLNIVCSICMTKGTCKKRGGSLFYSDEFVHSFSHKLLIFIINRFVNPVILPLMSMHNWLGLLAYLVLSMLFTLSIIIPLSVIGAVEVSVYTCLNQQRDIRA